MLQTVETRWYELFLHLGVERSVLEKFYTIYPFDDHSALIQAVALWLQKTNPSPSWIDLASVVEYYLLEGQAANEIRSKYCLGTTNKGM